MTTTTPTKPPPKAATPKPPGAKPRGHGVKLRVGKRITLLTGLLYLNLSRKGASVTVKVGPLGSLNLSMRGINWTGRTPVPGVSYSKRITGPLRRPAPPQPPAQAPVVVDAEYTEVPTDGGEPEARAAAAAAAHTDLTSALTNLGYKRKEATEAATLSISRLGAGALFEALVTDALQTLRTAATGTPLAKEQHHDHHH